MSSFQQHGDGDCWPPSCAMCREEEATEATHDLTKDRKCRRCGATDFQDEITTAACIDESLTVVARPGLEVDTCYVNPDGSAFFTPDGVGCIFYDDEESLLADAGEDYEVVYLDRRFEQ